MSLEVYSIIPTECQTVEGVRVCKRHSLFPFHSQQLTYQAWGDYLGTRLGFSTLFWALFNVSPYYRDQLFIFWLLSVGYLIDYLLIYNDPFAFLPVMSVQIPISYTTFMVALAMWVTYKTWKTEE